MKSQEKNSDTESKTRDFNYKIAIQASQELSDELFKENLFSKILNFSTSILNATKAILLINETGHFNIRAIQSNIIHEPIIVDSMNFQNSKDISQEIVEVVINTNKCILYTQSKDTPSNIAQEYLEEHEIQSLLCFPLNYKQKRIGILYLENDCASNLFPDEINEDLLFIFRQVTLALKNAILYSEMEKRLIDRTHEIEQQIEENVVQTEHLKLINRDLEDKNVKINQQKREIEIQSRQLELKNKELEKLYISAQKTDNAIVITDTKGEIEWVNEGFSRIYGYSLLEFIEEKGLTLEETSTNPEINTILQNVIKNKKSYSYNSRGDAKNNHTMWMRTTITPIIDENGEIYKLVAIDSDITKLKEAEEEILKQKEEIEAQRDLANEQNKQIQEQNAQLEKHQTELEKIVEKRTSQLKFAKERAEESDRLKSSFLANMSHEIRTPMNAIIGFSELIADEGIGNEQRKELVSHLNSNCNSLLHLIDDIIDIARIEAGQIRIFKQDCFINQLFVELYESFSETQLKENQHVELIADIETTDENLSVYTDPYRFRQIMNNLIGNAIKFTDRGFIKFGYQVEPEGYQGFVKFFVQDTGIGLNEKEKEEIFQQFRKIDSDKNNKLYRGAGLGLAISKNLIEELGGKIWIESKTGIGSTFQFTLPYQEADIKYKPEENFNKQYNWENKSILVAEDEDNNIKMLSLLLKKTNVEIVHAKDGIQALELYKNNPSIDLILLDIKMPKMSGLDATEQIRNFDKEIPILAFTAYAMPSDQQKATQVGCTDFIAKPIKKDKLLAKLDYYLNK